jgi:acyl carrier protein phosphodiesterase
VQYEESEFPTLYGIDGKYDFNDPDRESAANKYLEKIYTTLYSFTNDYLKDFSVTDEILSQNNLTKDNYTHYDVLCICLKEIARRFNQGIDTTYKELQERYAELEEKYNKLEVKHAVLQRRYDNVTNSENEKSKIIQ